MIGKCTNGMAWSVGLTVALILSEKSFAEGTAWRSAAPSTAPPATLGRPVATLGTPRAAAAAFPTSDAPRPSVDPFVTPTSFTAPSSESTPIASSEPDTPTAFRAQGADTYYPPSLAPPGAGLPPEEIYNQGMVVDPPPPPRSGWFGGMGSNWFGPPTVVGGAISGRSLFESDHEFEMFTSPTSNIFLNEDPRALTEIRPVYILQRTPTSNYVFAGGYINYFGTQARVAFTDRFSLVINKLGFIWEQPRTDTYFFAPHVGFSELWLGPKYTFIRNDQTNTLAAFGVTFQIPTGPAKVHQHSGNLSIAPYFSFGQNFLRTDYGSFNFLNTTGYAFRADRQRSEYFYTSFHFDYNVLNLNKFFPFLEINWAAYTRSGILLPLGFEGGDLINFGSTGMSGHNDFNLAFGSRWRFNSHAETGFALQFPLNGARDLLDWRLTVDFILRY